jgi:hypothetical protein
MEGCQDALGTELVEQPIDFVVREAAVVKQPADGALAPMSRFH